MAEDRRGVWDGRSCVFSATKGRNGAPSTEEEIDTKYASYPLVKSMISGEPTRNKSFRKDGHKQIEYVKSDEGWLSTVLVVEGRALDNILLPLTIISANAVIWTCVAELVLERPLGNGDNWEFFFGLVLNSSLSFLLVFRLNRAAERFWLAREAWGTIVGDSRHLVSGIQAHASHDPENQQLAVVWISAYAIATMQYMREIHEIPPDMLCGILDPSDVKSIETYPHPPLYCADRVRVALKDIFRVTMDTPAGLAAAWAQELDTLEKTLNRIMDQEGTMERIRSQPLPLVYVAHLRIFLLIVLLALPYIWSSALSWGTIPAVIISAFAMLGLEGAAVEVEVPFRRERTNHLDQDGFCMVILTTILQIIRASADREIESKAQASTDCEVEQQQKSNDLESSKE